VVDYNKFAVVIDYVGLTEKPNNRAYLDLFSTDYPKVYPCKLIKPYFNAGVMVVFKQHKKIFDTDLILKLPNITPLGDQDFLNWMTSYYEI